MNDKPRPALPPAARAFVGLITLALLAFILLLLTGSLAGVVAIAHWIVVTLRTM